MLNRDEDEEKPSSFESELATMDLADDDFLDETLLIGEVYINHISVNIKLIFCLIKYMQFIFYMLLVVIYTDLLFINNSLVCTQGPEQENTSTKWSRAPPPPLNPQIDTLAFQQIEIDHYIGNNSIFLKCICALKITATLSTKNVSILQNLYDCIQVNLFLECQVVK